MKIPPEEIMIELVQDLGEAVKEAEDNPYAEAWIICSCGHRIGGTYLKTEGYEFICLHCWTVHVFKVSYSDDFKIDVRGSDETRND